MLQLLTLGGLTSLLKVVTALWDSSVTRTYILTSLFTACCPPASASYPLSTPSSLLSLLWPLSGTVQLPSLTVAAIIVPAIIVQERSMAALRGHGCCHCTAVLHLFQLPMQPGTLVLLQFGLLMALPSLFFGCRVGS